MSYYDYRCSNEECLFEVNDVYQSIKDSPFTECPLCKQQSFSRTIYPSAIRCSPTTVGALAEANTKKMGRYELEDKRLADKNRGKAAAKQAKKEAGLLPGVERRIETSSNDSRKEMDFARKLNRMTPEQKQKYIMTGEGL